MPYKPLPIDHIRLFQIHKGVSNALYGSLIEVSLDFAPRYYALSYCWGTQQRSIPIQIDSHVLYVSPNQAGAIRRLRELMTNNNSTSFKQASSDIDIDVQYFWIDRICINQYDISERSSQVQLMGTIYSNAVRTLIWLGPDIDSCSNAWTLVDRIYEVFEHENPGAKFLTDIPCRAYSDARHIASGLPCLDHKPWKDLERLFELSWFTRVWVIQEVVLSSKDPLILHGKRHGYSWHRLGWASSWLRRNGYLRLAQVPNRMQIVDTISNIRRSPVRWGLDALLVATSTKCHATDQRDKVYGLLGIAAESWSTCGNKRQKLPEALRPDYALRVDQVYANVASFLLAKRKNLSVLTRADGVGSDGIKAQRKHNIERLPSWVPDWSDFIATERDLPKGLSWLEIPTKADGSTVVTLGFSDHYRASAGLEAMVLAFPDQPMLSATGLVTDSVLEASQFHSMSVSSTMNGAASESRLLDAWNMAMSSHLTGDMVDWVCSYIKATTADQYALWGRGEDQVLRDGAAFILEAMASGKREIENSSISRERKLQLVGLLEAMAANGDPASYTTLARNFCHNRAFIVTKQQRLGIGPAGARVGDEVAVMFGGGVPYILRRLDGDTSYLFVGESYIHRLMNGEAVHAWERGELALATLKIQ